MHTAAKVMLAIGGVVLLGSLAVTGVSVATADVDGLGALDLESQKIWESSSATDEVVTLENTSDYGLYVRGTSEDANASSWSVDLGSSPGTAETCEPEVDEWGEEYGCEDLGWTRVATLYEASGTVNVTVSDGDFILVDDGARDAALEDSLDGLAGAFGGSMLGCCGICFGFIFLIIGGIMAATMDSGQTAYMPAGTQPNVGFQPTAAPVAAPGAAAAPVAAPVAAAQPMAAPVAAAPAPAPVAATPMPAPVQQQAATDPWGQPPQTGY